jgi:branched-chain amino acid transport system substrate-binding protein
MRLRVAPALVLVAALPLVLSACSSSSSSASGGGSASASGSPTGDPIVIGFPADLSSTYAYYDVPMKEGATMAVDTINEAGGVLGRPLKLTVVDQRNDPAESSKVTQQMIDDNVNYLIGTTGDTVTAQGQLACGAGVPISTGDGTSPVLVKDMGTCAYQLLMNDTVQGATVAKYALDQGYKTALTLGSPEYPYTANLPKYFGEIFTAGGGKVTNEETFKIGAGDFSAVVTKIANVSPKPDMIFTPMFPPDTQVFMKQLRDAGVTTPLLSTDGNLDPSLADAGAKAVNGMVFSASVCPASADPKIAAFYADYKKRYGKEPSSVVAALGFDEVKILADTITKANSADRQAIIDGLKSVDYTGVTGHVVMDPDTRRAKKAVSLIKMDQANFTCLAQPDFPATLPSP